MPPDDEARLQRLVDAATSVARFIDGRTRDDLGTDEMLRLALTKLVEIIGEAAKQISAEGKTEHPNVPWSQAARMRDRLVHHYFDIDVDVLWVTVTEDLPRLVAQLQRTAAPRDGNGIP